VGLEVAWLEKVDLIVGFDSTGKQLETDFSLKTDPWTRTLDLQKQMTMMPPRMRFSVSFSPLLNV
jgi:hypothetical protein